MPTDPQETGRITMGKGCTMAFMSDPSQPPTSIERNWSRVHYNGQPNSWLPVIGNHWHRHHAEYMEVPLGRVQFYLKPLNLPAQTITLTPESSRLYIPAYAVHGFSFFEGEETVLIERTDPTGSFKEVFFRDLFGFGDASELTVVKAMRAYYDGDTFAALPVGWRWLDVVFTVGVGWVASWVFPSRVGDEDGVATKGQAMGKKML